MNIDKKLIFKVVKNPNFDELALSNILENAPFDMLNSPITKDQRNALMLFLSSDHSDETIISLLKKRFDFDATDSQGWTALHHAAIHRSAVVIEKMLELGFDGSIENLHGQVPLMFAAKYASDVEVVRLLVEASNDLSVTDIDGSNVMNYAINNSKVDMSSFLQSLGVENISPKQGLNSLHQAIKDDLSTDKIMELVHFPFIAPPQQLDDEEDDYRYGYGYDRYKGTIPSAIILAAIYSSRQKMMRFLLRNGASLYEQDALLKWTALMHAIASSRPRHIIEFFIEEKSDLLSMDAEGLTALALTAKYSENKKLFDNMLSMYEQIPNSKVHIEKAIMLTKYNSELDWHYKKQREAIEMGIVYDLFDNPNSSEVFGNLKENWETLSESEKSYTNPFELAIQNDDAKAVAGFWDNGVYIYYYPKHTNQAIIWSLAYQALTCFKLMVEEGACDEFEDYPSISLFEKAITLKSNKIIDFMIKEGFADPLEGSYQNTRTAFLEPFVKSLDVEGSATITYTIDRNDPEGSIIELLSGSPPILMAAIFGDTTTLEILLDAGSNINARDYSVGRTPLMWAVDVYEQGMVENLDNIIFLVERGADLYEITDDDENTSYSYLSQALTEEELNSIIELSGSEPRSAKGILKKLSQDSSFTAILKPFLQQWEEQKVQDSETDDFGLSPLMFAARRGFVDVLQLLLEHNVNVHDTDDYDRPALIYAVLGESSEALLLLLEHGANVNYVSYFGETALATAIEFERGEITKILLKHGANIEIVVEEIQILALELALSTISVDAQIISALIDAGCPVTGDLNRTVENQWKVLEAQGRKEKPDLLNADIFLCISLLEDLIGSPALNIVSGNNPYPGFAETVEVLLGAGSKIDAQDYSPYRMTPLMGLCHKIRSTMDELEIEELFHCLHDSGDYGIENIKVLLNHGADLTDIKDSSGKTGWDYLTNIFSEKGLADVEVFIKEREST